MITRPSAEPGDEVGLRRAKEIVAWLIKNRTEEQPPTWAWAEGWKLGMEEVLDHLTMELSHLEGVRIAKEVSEVGGIEPDYVLWQERWLAENPSLKRESKKARWRRAHAAWLEWRRCGR